MKVLQPIKFVSQVRQPRPTVLVVSGSDSNKFKERRSLL